MAGGPRWSKIEIQRLRVVAGMRSVPGAVPFFPGRSATGIRQKAFELGIVWRERRCSRSATEIARSINVATARVIAVAAKVGVPLRRYGTGNLARYAFTEEEAARIEEAVFDADHPDHPELELYYCRQCGRETMKPWGWRWRTDARKCGKRPLCHRCRVVARTTNRRALSYLVGSATRRARRAVREVERVMQEAG